MYIKDETGLTFRKFMLLRNYTTLSWLTKNFNVLKSNYFSLKCSCRKEKGNEKNVEVVETN